jgi:hypothetical protein
MSNALELLIMHHENMRILYPDDDLMVLCECDGSLYDTRMLTLHVLRSFDHEHQTSFFSRVSPEHLPVPLPDIEEVLCALEIPFGISAAITAWYCRHRWDMDGVRHAHRPVANVLKILSCLQMQQQTHIGLYAERAGRTEATCATMVSALGGAHGLVCEDRSVFLDDAPLHKEPERVLRAWHHFRKLGYLPIAVIDARAEAGHATMASLDRAVEVMFLQAREIREFNRVDVADQALANPNFMPWDLLNAQFRTRAPNLTAFTRPAHQTTAQAAVS